MTHPTGPDTGANVAGPNTGTGPNAGPRNPGADHLTPSSPGTPGSAQSSYHHPYRRPAHQTPDGTTHILLGQHWTPILNPYIADTFTPQPATADLHHALTASGYPDPMPAGLAASIAAKWGLPRPPLSPIEMTDTIPAAWICHVLATRGVTPYALAHDLPTYHAPSWT